MTERMQSHHLLFTRRTWRAQEPTSALRSYPTLIVPMEINAHKALHRELATVPVPDHFMANRVLGLYEPDWENPISNVENLARAFEDASHYHKAQPVERQLGQLIVESLMIQREYLIGHV